MKERGKPYTFDASVFDMALQYVIDSDRASSATLRVARRILMREIDNRVSSGSDAARIDYLSRCSNILEYCNTAPLRRGETLNDRRALLLRAHLAKSPQTAIRIIRQELHIREEITNAGKLMLLTSRYSEQDNDHDERVRRWAYRWKEMYEEMR